MSAWGDMDDEDLVETFRMARNLMESLRSESYRRMQERDTLSIKGEGATIIQHRATETEPENYIYVKVN